ncbi:MAG: TIGR00730 family Rossman fold protein [Pseudopedobacter saltans]|uniref:Cytokinin riboside 5'-monophosphate phosphoribohydrolase n=1 Tax=Pseudopedobacter saltans TaxID=151895 RepID=A0A2W5F0X7_9SPHI|nr:MAG: TIGR00730 family Rossman fold protein [Pseudopedobacter saltans]
MKSIAVFCGSSLGSPKTYAEQAFQLGKTLAKNNITLVYGGANVGLMGAVADGAIENGGKVIGVLPHFLQEKEIGHPHLAELILVDNMHQRKTKMNELSEGVIMLPGGFGTFEEFFEMLTWAQLGLHKKPIALLNTEGFYDELLQMFDTMVEKGFVKQMHKDMVLHDENIGILLGKIKNYIAPEQGKWIKSNQL